VVAPHEVKGAVSPLQVTALDLQCSLGCWNLSVLEHRMGWSLGAVHSAELFFFFFFLVTPHLLGNKKGIMMVDAGPFFMS
jgi:hypothetical protein